jgi:hypothetical protein
MRVRFFRGGIGVGAAAVGLVVCPVLYAQGQTSKPQPAQAQPVQALVTPPQTGPAHMTWPAAKVQAAAPAATPTVPASPIQPGPLPQVAPGKPTVGPAEKPADLAHDAPPAAKKDGVWPRLVERVMPPLVTPIKWSDQEIAAAQSACVAVLKDLDIVAIGAEPVREGECGTAAPIELISVGKAPQVTFSPPVIVTCDMAAALHKWINNDLQPLAKKHLGSPLIRVDTMSSYSCRTAYGRAKNKLSEHGKANAIDIRAFLTAKASTADVLAGWGPTARDIEAQIIASRAAAAKAEALAKAPVAPAGSAVAGKASGSGPPMAAPPAAAFADTTVTRPAVTIGPQGGPGVAFPGSSGSGSAIGLSTGMPQPSRLGGPKPPEPKLRGTSTVEQPGTYHGDGQSQFLRGAHASACRVFGTVLGPEANNAHRNHFHVDMAKRQSASFCE